MVTVLKNYYIIFSEKELEKTLERGKVYHNDEELNLEY